jgi:diguanylate cyclase (GGDEF)-like protein
LSQSRGSRAGALADRDRSHLVHRSLNAAGNHRGVERATTTPPPSLPATPEAELFSADGIARFIADLPSGVAVFDRELRYVAANVTWAEALGLAGIDLAGRRHEEVGGGDDGGRFAAGQRRALAGDIVEAWPLAEDCGDGRTRTVGFRPRRAGDGSIVGVVAALGDSVRELTAPAWSPPDDRLTGITGREGFLGRVRTVLAAPARYRRNVAVFLVDIDDFKGINALYGTRIGDRVLAAVATRLVRGVRSRPGSRQSDRPTDADLVARLGADEFGVVMGGGALSPADAEAFALRLLQLAAAPVVVGRQRIRLTANVGYLIIGPGHCSEDDALRDLNAALQEAKLCGPNSVKPWDPALTSVVGRRLALLDELRRALDEGEFVLHYQPILSLGDQRAAGAEALLRWKHPRQGLIPPGDFLPLLEESGLIVPVGRWIIREAMRQMQLWRRLYGRDMVDWLSINVSAKQFNNPSLLLATLEEIGASGVPLDRIKLEITESAVMRNPDVTRAVLGELQHIGIRVGLDDFGTGYSALGALRHYRVDMIKIDRDFTSRLDTADGRELVAALLKIARIYGAAVVAEGVESAEQQTALQALGCDFGQGYLYARPMDGALFGAYALTRLVHGLVE